MKINLIADTKRRLENSKNSLEQWQSVRLEDLSNESKNYVAEMQSQSEKNVEYYTRILNVLESEVNK